MAKGTFFRLKIKVSFEKLNLLSVKDKAAKKRSLIEIELDFTNSTKFFFSNSDKAVLLINPFLVTKTNVCMSVSSLFPVKIELILSSLSNCNKLIIQEDNICVKFFVLIQIRQNK